VRQKERNSSSCERCRTQSDAINREALRRGEEKQRLADAKMGGETLSVRERKGGEEKIKGGGNLIGDGAEIWKAMPETKRGETREKEAPQRKGARKSFGLLRRNLDKKGGGLKDGGREAAHITCPARIACAS